VIEFLLKPINKKATRRWLIFLIYMVGDASFELATPAVSRLKHIANFLFKINKLAHHAGAKVV